MHERVLSRIQELTRRGDVYLTLHAEEELAADDLTIYDVESIILSGRIARRQRDTIGFKYVIVGPTIESHRATVVCKVAGDVVVITVFLGTL